LLDGSRLAAFVNFKVMLLGPRNTSVLRMNEAAESTMGNIVAHEISHDRIQRIKKV
jgi:hypothetical protein